MKKLKFYLMLLVVALATGAKAESVKYLVLNAGGEQTVIALADNPILTISDGMLKVKVAGEEKVSASLADGLSYSFQETVPTGIAETLATEESSRLEQGHVYIANAQKGEVVRIFTADGKLVATQYIDDNGSADVDLTALGKGLYIVKTTKTAVKIIKH
jgi:hypothetical protein